MKVRKMFEHYLECLWIVALVLFCFALGLSGFVGILLGIALIVSGKSILLGVFVIPFGIAILSLALAIYTKD